MRPFSPPAHLLATMCASILCVPALVTTGLAQDADSKTSTLSTVSTAEKHKGGGLISDGELDLRMSASATHKGYYLDDFPQSSEVFTMMRGQPIVTVVTGEKAPSAKVEWFATREGTPAKYKGDLTLVRSQDDGSGAEMTWSFPTGALPGTYSVRLRINGKMAEDDWKARVMFNPYNPADDAYIKDAATRDAAFAKSALHHTKWPGSAKGGYVALDAEQQQLAFEAIANLPADVLKSADATFQTLVTPAAVSKDGVLRNKWDGSFAGGKKPWEWTHSQDIYKTWKGSNGSHNQPGDGRMSIVAVTAPSHQVKYGQCWVFASVTTSMGRSLGIGTRSVTNLNSAHERKPFDAAVKKRANKIDALTIKQKVVDESLGKKILSKVINALTNNIRAIYTVVERSGANAWQTQGITSSGLWTWNSGAWVGTGKHAQPMDAGVCTGPSYYESLRCFATAAGKYDCVFVRSETDAKK